MALKCLYEPQRAPESLYMTVIRNMHFMSNYYGVSGEQVATWANERLHGGKKQDN